VDFINEIIYFDMPAGISVTYITKAALCDYVTDSFFIMIIMDITDEKIKALTENRT